LCAIGKNAKTMITNRLKLAVILLLFLLSSKGYSSEPHWTCFPTSIYLANGDSLIGCVLLYELSEENLLITNNKIGFCSSLEYVNSKVDTIEWGKNNRVVFSSVTESDSLISWIKIKDISSVKVFGDELRTFSIDYINLEHNNTLWKIIRRNDSAFICNDMIIPFESINGAAKKMFLVTPTERIDMYSFGGWFISNSRTDNLLIKFINKRYNKDFKKKDFKGINAMLDYILENK
jgi:hypothetical protein